MSCWSKSAFAPLLCAFTILSACGPANIEVAVPQARSLSLISTLDGADADFEIEALQQFTQARHQQLQYLPNFFVQGDPIGLYRELFRQRSEQPDLVGIDAIWSPSLADDLVDLTPYLGAAIHDFPAQALKPYLVDGRLLGLPTYIEAGLLYYRADLLRKYGFSHPPATWTELEQMSARIQAGERQAGHPDFWGYVWQGAASEGLTCNALEWQLSQGGGQIIELNRTISVSNPRAAAALERAARWVGTISPPGVTNYDEADSANVFKASKAAFLRSWSYEYSLIKATRSGFYNQVSVTVVPGGVRTVGGLGIGVSRYSPNRAEAVAALLRLTAADTQAARTRKLGIIPTRTGLLAQPDLMQATVYHGALAGQALTNVQNRPVALAGRNYDAVSKAYFYAVHNVISHRQPAAEALQQLQAKLVAITGYPAVHQ